MRPQRADPDARQQQPRRRDAERAKHAAAAQGAVRRQRGHRRAVFGVDGGFSSRARKKPSARAGEPGGGGVSSLSASGSSCPGEGGSATGPASPCSLQKSVDLSLALGLEHRAGGVEQPTAGREQRPEGVEQARLGRRQRRQVARRGAASGRRDGGGRCPRRCTARRAGSRRRRGRPTSSVGVAGVGDTGLGAQAEPGERLVDARQPAGVAVDGEEVEIGELEQVRGLAAGRGAGVEDAARRARRAAGRSRSGAARWAALILDRDHAGGEARQLRHRHRPCQRDRRAADERGVDPVRRELGDVRRRRWRAGR